MYELYPYFTNDGSVGLFSPSEDDIYHSTYGALSEANEKFIIPSGINNFVKKNSSIKVLDLCFGIGYNSKSFLELYYEQKRAYNEEIDTNNILCNKVFLTAIDTDKNLAFLSPFFIYDKKKIKNEDINFFNDKVFKLLEKDSAKKYKLSKEINIVLLNKLIECDNSILEDEEIENILESKKYSKYFDKYMLNLVQFYKNKGYSKTSKGRLWAFLHNIYYRHVSRRHKRALNLLGLNELNFNLIIQDARKTLREVDTVYDYIFLDAFAPEKCPCLWTLDFFKLLFNHLSDDGTILTYSNSAAVRNAFVKAGFCVGKIYNENTKKFTGTIACKTTEKITYPLTEFDMGLLNTKAGIIYRDESLTGLNEDIIGCRDKEFENSTLQCSSKYIKQYKGEK